jgi:hypothetical protein
MGMANPGPDERGRYTYGNEPEVPFIGPELPPNFCRKCHKPAKPVGDGWRCCGTRWCMVDDDQEDAADVRSIL